MDIRYVCIIRSRPSSDITVSKYVHTCVKYILGGSRDVWGPASSRVKRLDKVIQTRKGRREPLQNRTGCASLGLRTAGDIH